MKAVMKSCLRNEGFSSIINLDIFTIHLKIVQNSRFTMLVIKSPGLFQSELLSEPCHGIFVEMIK